MDAPDVVESNNHLLYCAVSTDTAQLLTVRKKNRKKNGISVRVLHAEVISSILYITYACVDTASA